MICPLCGKRIRTDKTNMIIVDGQVVHKKCPTGKPEPKLSTEEYKEWQELLDAIARELALHAKGYVVNSGLSWEKVGRQIKALKEKGYTYKDQFFALGETVKKQDGFYGYTAVVNNIDAIMIKKKEQERIKQEIKAKKQSDIAFDLSKIMKGSDDEW